MGKFNCVIICLGLCLLSNPWLNGQVTNKVFKESIKTVYLSHQAVIETPLKDISYFGIYPKDPTILSVVVKDKTLCHGFKLSQGVRLKWAFSSFNLILLGRRDRRADVAGAAATRYAAEPGCRRRHAFGDIARGCRGCARRLSRPARRARAGLPLLLHARRD